jgi:hypothetical protein
MFISYSHSTVVNGVETDDPQIPIIVTTVMGSSASMMLAPSQYLTGKYMTNEECDVWLDKVKMQLVARDCEVVTMKFPAASPPKDVQYVDESGDFVSQPTPNKQVQPAIDKQVQSTKRTLMSRCIIL